MSPHREERIRAVREAAAIVATNRAKMAGDEIAENVERGPDGAYRLVDDRGRPVPSAVIWTEHAGRVRCTTPEAFAAIARGAASHPDATPEPIARVPHPITNPHRGDPAFWRAVLRRCRRALGQPEPLS